MATATAFHNAQDLPHHVLDMIDGRDWARLARALDNGLPANLMSMNCVSLFERVLAELESGGDDPSTASEQGPIDLLESFIKARLDSGVLQEGTMTAAGLACVYGQWAWARRLVALGMEIEAPGNGPSSILHGLIDGRYQRAMGLLSSADDEVPMDAPAMVFDTPKEYGEVSDIITFLVQSGADADAVDDYASGDGPTFSPIGRAISVNDDAAVQGLILAGADLDFVQRVEGFSGRAIDLAIVMGSEESVRMLLGAGAGVDPNPHSPDPSSAWPLALAAKLGRTELLEDIIAEMDPGDLPRVSAIALHMAAGADHLRTFKTLLAMGVPMDIQLPPSGFSAFHQAAFNGATRMIDFFLRQGLSWDLRSDAGMSVGDVIRQAQPALAERYSQNVVGSNIRHLGIHKKKIA